MVLRAPTSVSSKRRTWRVTATCLLDSTAAMPTRQLNGAVLEMRTGFYVEELQKSVTRWGIIRTQAGEFIVPDVPCHGIIPLTPQIALVKDTPDGTITEQNLAQANTAMRSLSESYNFARELASCPFE
jgi:hypothetical protein